MKYPYCVFSICLVTGLWCDIACRAQDITFDTPERGFVSWMPAPSWEDALLTGNGTMGALVMGHPHQETIILNDARLYLPQERSVELIDQAGKLEEIRQLIRDGKYDQAGDIPAELRKTTGYSDQRDPFIPAFDLRITQEAANIQRYQRSTDFTTGEAKVTWQDGVGTFERSTFTSRADSMLVLRITSDHPINVTLEFDHRPVEWNQWSFVNEHVASMNRKAEGEWLQFRAVFTKEGPDGLTGYSGVGRVRVSNGQVTAKDGHLKIRDATQVLLLVKIIPEYKDHPVEPQDIRDQLAGNNSDYEKLLSAHVKIHGEMFQRTRLNLHSSPADRSLFSEELLHRASEERAEVPLALIEKTFDAGRYNILSATGSNPPNLQGIWSGTWTAPWSSGFTHDGNLPSAMSGVLSANLPELMSAYSNYLTRHLPEFRYNSRRLFGMDGINLPGHTTTTGIPTDFNETWCLTLWTGGAGWAGDILYDYYRYTGDREYLKNIAYPWLKECARFYKEFITMDSHGEWLFNPSYSPENNPANSSSQAVLNATMDVMIARQVLLQSIEAGQLLGEKKNVLDEWKELLSHAPAYEVNKEGVFCEWLPDSLKENYRHRHVSQLYSLFNHRDPQILNDTLLTAGVSRLIDRKLKFREDENGGEMAFGLVQLGLSAAHLGNNEQAAEAIQWLASRYWSTGFGSFHNVGGLFNTDISGGLPAVIIEMLVYSEMERIDLLPALPNEWESGNISGVLLRNQIELKDLTWEPSGCTATLQSAIDQIVTITYGTKEQTVRLKKSMPSHITF